VISWARESNQGKVVKMNRTKPLSGDLLKLQQQIESYALEFGLDFYEVRFEVCDYDTINILASQGGFPTRYPHWRFGMDYDQLSKGYAYGMQKIYEMVINTNPCYAYLLNANHWVDQKIVMAHVYGHADFFKNNYWFSFTNRRMMDVCANHGTKIRRYMELYGQDEVEQFIDCVHSLENLLDVQVLFETQETERKRKEDNRNRKDDDQDNQDDRSQALKSFMSAKVKEDKKKESLDKTKPDLKNVLTSHISSKDQKHTLQKGPQESVRDVMRFMAEHAPLEEWQSDVIGILREEAYYFLPQRMTKIMNEGWASYWHSTIMTTRALQSQEMVDFADHHAGVMQMSKTQLNPYKIGLELYRDIEHRWDTGKFGKEYWDCESLQERESWNRDTRQGRAKIFEIRKTHNDITFIDEFLTPEFCERAKLFTYKFNPRTGRNEVETREFQALKQKLLSQLTNFGQPVIEIEDANFSNRGELLLNHVHYGVDLDMNYAADTLKNLYFLWKRPVNLSTKYDDKKVIFCFDGKEMRPLH
jgi:stage V sporulation protein R